jgi:hypothetical protein
MGHVVPMGLMGHVVPMGLMGHVVPMGLKRHTGMRARGGPERTEMPEGTEVRAGI